MATTNSQPATKSDLKKLGVGLKNLERNSKSDFKKLENKLVSKLASKADLNGLASKAEVYRLEQKMDDRFEEMEQQMIKNKSEIISHIDPILKEVQASREERIVSAHQISRNSDRLDSHDKIIKKVEEKVFA